MHSLWLLTATWVAGAPVDPPPVTYAPAPQPQMVRVISSGGTRFVPAYPAAQDASPYHAVMPAQPVAQGGTVLHYSAPAGRPLAESGYAPATLPTGTVSGMPIRVINMPSMNFAENPREKAGHEYDYSRITGYLYYVHTDGGRWVLRYAGLDEVDRYGGSVVLASSVEMGNFREGDLVTVYGAIVNEGRASRSLGGPLYRVDMIEMRERK